MDILSNLKYAEGSHKKRKRVGRGEGSGHGAQSTRGMNGQKSRSGAKFRAWFEGGQMPLQRRIPKYGFKSPFRKEYQTVNVYQLQAAIDTNKFKDATITAASLYQAGLISSGTKLYKILGEGELKAKVNIEANAFSKSAKEKIEAAGGTIKTI